VKAVFDDWQLSGLTTFTSGQPLGIGYSLVSGADLVGASGGGIDSRVNLLRSPILPKDQRSPLRHRAYTGRQRRRPLAGDREHTAETRKTSGPRPSDVSPDLGFHDKQVSNSKDSGTFSGRTERARY
jgi:hypothetical protein